MRTVEDHHVDRPDVEAQQCVKLTGTNCSIGLIVLIFSICEFMSTQYLTYLSFAGLVTMAKCLNPIPSRTRPLNTSALMVLHLKVWESKSLPGLLKTNKQKHILPFFFTIVPFATFSTLGKYLSWFLSPVKFLARGGAAR